MTTEKIFTTLLELQGSEQFLTSARQHLHCNPELSRNEKQTAAWVADQLEDWGFEVARGIGGHGVVGTLRQGAGRSIALRADTDALPIKEETGKVYASRNAGVMHACGHDGHTVMLLGAAQHLAKTRRFSGTVHCIFQPAEEVTQKSGAQLMIEDGLFERFPCDAIFGMHNHPGHREGTFMFGKGAFMSASDRAYLRIIGKGGHAARPHHCVDPIVVASSIVMALQTIVSRNVDPTQTAVVTVGKFQAGDAPNVIPPYVDMALSIRSFQDEVRELLQQRITEVVQMQAASYGATAEIRYDRNQPVLVNTAAETEIAVQVATELVGAQQVVFPFGPIVGSEDFAFFLQHRPGCYFRIGNGLDSVKVHHPMYDFNDANLTVGAAFWTRLAERFLASPAPA